jgi:hypothetical protein
MDRGDRAMIPESGDQIILINDLRGSFPGDDCAKRAVHF